MEQNNVSKIIVGFFMIILGLVLISTVANSSDLVTGKIDVINEAIDISSARLSSNSINVTVSNFTIANIPSGWKLDDCLPSGIVYGNATADFSSGADYNFYASIGILQVLNTSTTAINSEVNDTFLDYVYCPDTYLNIAWGRSIISLVAGFFALAILGLGLGLFYSVAKDAGIL